MTSSSIQDFGLIPPHQSKTCEHPRLVKKGKAGIADECNHCYGGTHVMHDDALQAV